MLKDSEDYLNRLKELREQIEKNIQEKTLVEVYKNIFKILGSLFGNKKDSDLVHDFEKELVNKAIAHEKTGSRAGEFEIEFFNKIKEAGFDPVQQKAFYKYNFDIGVGNVAAWLTRGKVLGASHLGKASPYPRRRTVGRGPHPTPGAPGDSLLGTLVAS